MNWQDKHKHKNTTKMTFKRKVQEKINKLKIYGRKLAKKIKKSIRLNFH